MKKLKSTLRIAGTEYVGEHSFLNGRSVPIYEVHTIHGLTQIIGYAKFNNNNYGNVFYRGECKIHHSLIPSLFRGSKHTSEKTKKLNKLLHLIHTDDRFYTNPAFIRTFQGEDPIPAVFLHKKVRIKS